MKIGLIGLGKMGQQILGRLHDAGHHIVATDVNAQALAAAAAQGATTATTPAELVQKLGNSPVVWIMIPHDGVEPTLSTLIDAMPSGGTIIDGGNSDFRETKRRAELARQRGVVLIDVGVSGGVLGRSAGFSLMVGGDKPTANNLQPIFEALAAPGGWGYFGGSGAGHYIKMVHNAIEYALMESYAEGYRLLQEGSQYPGLNLAQIASVWEHGSVIGSKLNELTGQVLRRNPGLDGIDGYVAESGEASWALEVAGQDGIGLPAIQSAADVRRSSQGGQVNFGTKLLAALRNAFGGHPLNKPPQS